MVNRLRSSFSDRRIVAVASLGLLSILVLAMLAARIGYTGTRIHSSLAWDLALAWLPFVLSLVIYVRARAGAPLRVLASLGCLWLVFFPNAPYLVTEVRHVERGDERRALFDGLLLSTAGLTGLLLGLTSLFLIHAVVRGLTRAESAWSVVVAVLALTSFGIYVGRVLRWNSWDVIAHPHWLPRLLVEGVQNPLGHQRPLALMVLLTLFLLASYLVLFCFARQSAEWADALERPRR